MLNKNKIGSTLLILAIGFVIGFMIRKPKTETIEVPVKIEVPVPVVETDTIWKDKLVPVPVDNREVDEDLLVKFETYKDSIEMIRELYKDCITKNTYVETFDDSIQTITAVAKTTGTLDSLGIKYKTKPRTISLDTTIPVEMPSLKRDIVILGKAGSNLQDFSKPILEVGVMNISPKGVVTGATYDFSNKTVSVVLGKRFRW